MQLETETALGAIKNGILTVNNGTWFKNMLARYEDCKVRVIIERLKYKRSNEQNNYYWGVVLPTISQSQGNTPEELHEIFSAKFLSTKRVWRGGDITTVKSTTKLKKGEFVSYIMDIVAEVATLGIEIPEPDPLYDSYTKEEYDKLEKKTIKINK